MRGSGKLAIVGMFTVSVLLAGFAWWYHYQQGVRVLGWWGSEAIELIRTAPEVHVLWLDASRPIQSDAPPGTRLSIGGQSWKVIREVDLSRAPGLIHARHALVEDESYAWTVTPHSDTPQWDFALRFRDGQRRVTVAFDMQSHRALWVERGTEIAMTDAIERLHDYLVRRGS